MSDQNQSSIPGLFVLAIIGYGVYSYATSESSPKKSSSELASEAAEDKRKGFHCLSAWDGSHKAFADDVKDMMRDPDSFEVIDTRVTPVASDGTHSILMDYRSRNGFGGMNVAVALGSFRNSDCKHTIISIE